MLPLMSFSSKISKCETDDSDSVVSIISNSLVYIKSSLEGKYQLLIDNTSSIYLNVKLKVTASDLFFFTYKFFNKSCFIRIQTILFVAAGLWLPV